MTDRHWQASYGSIPCEINADIYPSVTAMLEVAMTRFADKTAFVSAGQKLSYAEIDALSRDFCAYLQSTGVKKGDRVAVMLPNIMAFPVVCLGVLRAGAIQANVNPMYTPRELEHQLNDSGSERIVVFGAVAPTLAAVLVNTKIHQIITVPAPAAGNALGEDVAVESLPQAVGLRAALIQGAKRPRQPVALTGDDLLFLQYTGGTTGPSKGAALSHRNLVANTEQFKSFMPENTRAGEEVIVTAIPLYHLFALMVNFITYFSVGAENWLVANPRDMDGFVETMRQARPTVFTGVNTLYAGLTQHPKLPEVDWSRMGLAVGGGAAVIGAVSDRWKAITGTFIREGYGMSETAPVISFNPAYITDFTGTTGLPMPSMDVRLLDDQDRPVPVGESGEICVKGPQVMRGYWDKPEANAAAFTADGFFRTGDVGVFDRKGFLKIVDRKKDMVIVSGFNVYPNEVEEVATACKGVLECACVGAPDDKTGEAVKLFVVKAPGATLTEEELMAHCRANMTGYKVPRIVRFVDALPKSTVGKILRRELRNAA